VQGSGAGQLSQLDDAEPGGVRYGIRAPYGVKLIEKRANVELGGVNRYAEPAGDDFVRGSFGKKRQHFEFTGCQCGLSIRPRAYGCRRHNDVGRLSCSHEPKT